MNMTRIRILLLHKSCSPLLWAYTQDCNYTFRLSYRQQPFLLRYICTFRRHGVWRNHVCMKDIQFCYYIHYNYLKHQSISCKWVSVPLRLSLNYFLNSIPYHNLDILFRCTLCNRLKQHSQSIHHCWGRNYRNTLDNELCCTLSSFLHVWQHNRYKWSSLLHWWTAYSHLCKCHILFCLCTPSK